MSRLANLPAPIRTLPKAHTNGPSTRDGSLHLPDRSGGKHERFPRVGPFDHRARARAVENRLPVPTNVEEALQPPLAQLWGASLPVLRAHLSDPTTPWRPVWETLTRS